MMSVADSGQVSTLRRSCNFCLTLSIPALATLKEDRLDIPSCSENCNVIQQRTQNNNLAARFPISSLSVFGRH